MQFQATGRSLNDALASAFPAQSKRTLIVEPGEDNNLRILRSTLRQALGRVRQDGRIQFHPGDYPGFEIIRGAELTVPDVGKVFVKETVESSATNVLLQGFNLTPDEGASLIVKAGTVFCLDTEFSGPIIVEAGATLYLSNCSISGSTASLILNGNAQAEVIASRFHDCIKAIDANGSADVGLFNVLVDECGEEASSATASFEGGSLKASGLRFENNATHLEASGSVSLDHCFFRGGEGPVLVFSPQTHETQLQAFHCKFVAETKSAIRALSGVVHLEHCEQCHSDVPTVELTGTAELGAVEACELSGSTSGEASESAQTGSQPIALAEKAIDTCFVRGSISQLLKRIVNIRWLFQQRLNNHSSSTADPLLMAFLGDPHCGQTEAAKGVAQALREINAVENADSELILPEELPLIEGKKSFYLLDATNDHSGALSHPAFLGKLLATLKALPQNSGLALMGHTNQIYTFFRSNPLLKAKFSQELTFGRLTPDGLAQLFEIKCEEGGVVMSDSAARKLIVLLHAFYEGFSQRVFDTLTLEEFFNEVYTNYLLRRDSRPSSPSELLEEDLPSTGASRATGLLSRSPDLVTTCPSCGYELPWLPELGDETHCPKCGEKVSSHWGHLKNQPSKSSAQPSKTGLKSGAVSSKMISRQAVRSVPPESVG